MPLTVLNSWCVALGCGLGATGSHLQALGIISASPPQLGMRSWLAFGDPSDGMDPEGIVGRETRPSEGSTPGNPKGSWYPLAFVTLRGRLRQNPLPSFWCSFMPVGSCSRRGRVNAFSCTGSWARASFSHLFLRCLRLPCAGLSRRPLERPGMCAAISLHPQWNDELSEPCQGERGRRT